jgi:hypothetical protein
MRYQSLRYKPPVNAVSIPTYDIIFEHTFVTTVYASFFVGGGGDLFLNKVVLSHPNLEKTF